MLNHTYDSPVAELLSYGEGKADISLRLAQLRARAGAHRRAQPQPDSDDAGREELPQVFALIRAEAIDPLDELLLAPMDYNSTITLAVGVGAIVKASPGLRDRDMEVLTRGSFLARLGQYLLQL